MFPEARLVTLVVLAWALATHALAETPSMPSGPSIEAIESAESTNYDAPLGDLALAQPLPGGTWILLSGIAAIALMIFLNRRFALGSARPGASLRMIGTLPLGDKRAIALVEAEDEKMLVGITPQNVNLLCRLPSDPEAPRSSGSDALGPATSDLPDSNASASVLAPAGARFASALTNAFHRRERES